MALPTLNTLSTGELWAEFCDELKVAGNIILDDDVSDDPLTRAEGFRYLTRLLRLSLEKHLEFSDARRPQFYSLSHETAKIGNDNPDNHYLNCAVDGACQYRIWGNRGTVSYMSIESKAGSFAGKGDMAPTGHIALDDLDCDSEGNFELWLGGTPRAGNYLPMVAATDNLLVRQTFRDRQREQPARLSIECLDDFRPEPLSPQAFAQALGRVVPFVSGTAGLFRSWMAQFASHRNQLPANDQQMCLAAGGDPAIHYHNSCWALAQDEALVIRFRPPQHCRGWNFQLSNDWMESLDYRYHRISLNQDTACSTSEGSICLVVAHDNPGPAFPNWLETAGHKHGAMLLRYIQATDFPPVETSVESLEALRGGVREATA